MYIQLTQLTKLFQRIDVIDAEARTLAHFKATGNVELILGGMSIAELIKVSMEYWEIHVLN